MVTLIQVVSMVHYTIDLTLTGECVARCGMRVAYWKCVSLEVDPSIAAWCACLWESFRMIRVEGVKAWAI